MESGLKLCTSSPRIDYSWGSFSSLNGEWIETRLTGFFEGNPCRFFLFFKWRVDWNSVATSGGRWRLMFFLFFKWRVDWNIVSLAAFWCAQGFFLFFKRRVDWNKVKRAKRRHPGTFFLFFKWRVDWNTTKRTRISQGS